MLGLTPTESAIASLLAERCTLRRIAVTTDREYSTVRTRLKHVFVKLGVSRQFEATQLVRSLSGLSVSRDQEDLRRGSVRRTASPRSRRPDPDQRRGCRERRRRNADSSRSAVCRFPHPPPFGGRGEKSWRVSFVTSDSRRFCAEKRRAGPLRNQEHVIRDSQRDDRELSMDVIPDGSRSSTSYFFIAWPSGASRCALSIRRPLRGALAHRSVRQRQRIRRHPGCSPAGPRPGPFCSGLRGRRGHPRILVLLEIHAPSFALDGDHVGFEAAILDALEAMDGLGLRFNRHPTAEWPGFWYLSATDEFDMAGGGILIVEHRRSDRDGVEPVAFNCLNEAVAYLTDDLRISVADWLAAPDILAERAAAWSRDRRYREWVRFSSAGAKRSRMVLLAVSGGLSLDERPESRARATDRLAARR